MMHSYMDGQENLYRKQIRELRDYAVFFIDKDGVIKTWNAGVEHLLGYSEPEWINQHSSIIFCPTDQAAALCEAEISIASEKGSASDIRWHRKKDGTELFANGVINAVYGPSGELEGFTKIISDETARKQLEDSLVAANTGLEHFAYAASHDLQEPLRTIGSYAQLLARQERDHLSPAGLEYLTFITSSVARMNTLIQGLLAYARAGAVKEPVITASLDEEVESAISQLGGAIDEARATVTHDPLPTVTAEHSQITRLFLNLIGNAIKYRSAERRPEIHISAWSQDDHWIVISVADNGIGFDQKYAEKIFSPFTRLHGQEYSGSGVGLTICQRIVERWGGRIWAESTPGKGSTFYFTLPEAKDN
jgi:PAS domain S-box-containing protein